MILYSIFRNLTSSNATLIETIIFFFFFFTEFNFPLRDIVETKQKELGFVTDIIQI